jgi:hypothetical protein
MQTTGGGYMPGDEEHDRICGLADARKGKSIVNNSLSA